MVPVEGHCWSLGLQAFVALQGEFSLAKFAIPASKACRVSDLATKTEYVSASAMLGFGAQKNLQDDTGLISVGLAEGLGVAKQWCKTKINVPLYELMGGRF